MEEKNPKIRLLFVDDEEEILESVSKGLERRNIEVIKAKNGEEAIRHLYENDFDVALLDIKMPGIDGIEVFRRFKSKKPEMPVLILTGHGTVGQAFNTVKDGVYDYLDKPIDIEILAEKIKTAFKSKTGQETEDFKEPLQNINILIVDDEEELASSLKKVFERRNMTATLSSRGEEALEILKTRSFDVIILDIRMPGIDGIETLRRIRNKYPKIIVILLTGHPDVENAVEGIKLGAAEYVVKPPDIEKLTEAIQRSVSNRYKEIMNMQNETINKVLDKLPE